MAPILTVTLSPTIDMASEAEVVRPTHKVRTAQERFDPGGGGINVARVIAMLGGAVEAAYLAGGITGALLDQLVAPTGIEGRPFPIAGATRVSYTVHERSTGLEYRFVASGPEVSVAELEPCLALLRETDSRWIVASGSLPRGLPPETFARMADIAAQRGARFVLDSSGEALAATLDRSRVFLVKPSRGELEQFVGHPLDEMGVREAALALVRRGAAEMVAVTLGAGGAVLASKAGITRVPALHVPVRSAVGAGDSFLGAMTFALAADRSPEEALRLAIAAGAAAVLTPGTTLCRREDVLRLYAEAEACETAG